jgi:hypothetical protein
MTNQEIKTVGQTIAQETQIGGNTAARVGGVVEGIGVALDNKDAANGYYQATINGGTITVNAPNYLLGSGGNLRIKMPSAGTTASTLTIGNANAVQLWYNGAAVSAQNTWEADEIITVFYDGTRFMASNSQGGGGKAEKVKYNNSQSGLAAENVQGAVDELTANGDLYEDCLANCIHEASSTGITTTISNANLVNKNASWSTSSKGRLILIASALIDVTGANRIKLAVNSSAVASGSNIVQYTLPMYDSSKTYLSSLDLGWKAIGTVPYIEIDLTSSTYANVAYVGLYLGASKATTQIYNTDVNPSGITYTLYMPAFYTTKAVDEAGLEDYINNYDVLSNCHHSTGGGVVTEGVEST